MEDFCFLSGYFLSNTSLSWQNWFGHANIQNTVIYAYFNDAGAESQRAFPEDAEVLIMKS